MGNFESEHTVSIKNITEMDGLEKLTEVQKIQILNNTKNFTCLTKTANASKGSKRFMEGVTYKKKRML